MDTELVDAQLKGLLETLSVAEQKRTAMIGWLLDWRAFLMEQQLLATDIIDSLRGAGEIQFMHPLAGAAPATGRRGSYRAQPGSTGYELDRYLATLGPDEAIDVQAALNFMVDNGWDMDKRMNPMATIQACLRTKRKKGQVRYMGYNSYWTLPASGEGGQDG